MQRSPADCYTFLGQKVLTPHIRIVAVLNEPLAQPTFKAIEPLRTLRRLEWIHPARRHVAFHRVEAALQLPRDPLQTHPHALRRNISATSSRVFITCPWINPRRAFRDSLLVHSLSPRLSKEGAIPRDAEGAVFLGARTRRVGLLSCPLDVALLHAFFRPHLAVTPCALRTLPSGWIEDFHVQAVVYTRQTKRASGGMPEAFFGGRFLSHF
ncbi:hypothetical protein AAFG13_37280 [Bradyrhizobium sp. B124]|uniref:hypothetical protein n=1 Tax=Bradyrhizobium sp. B124 TaxID=3140245 RepID=UPI0031844EA2